MRRQIQSKELVEIEEQILREKNFPVSEYAIRRSASTPSGGQRVRHQAENMEMAQRTIEKRSNGRNGFGSGTAMP
ncbi:MAG: hypothetical protein NTY46_10145 [Candidatus Sumerlaeota bacterium]|nr:hypothetical protein [Candidatus Sumerlaeota bacterium]